MWLSKKLTAQRQEETTADLGVTTISGDKAGVLARGEVRQLPIFGPAGLVWMPRDGDTVLVIKGGTGGEESCVAGTQQGTPPGGMHPGEVYLHCGVSSIWLRSNGQVDIRGELYINGEKYKPPEGVLGG